MSRSRPPQKPQSPRDEDTEKDEGHDALLQVYHWRYSEQIETTTAQTVLSRWS